MADDRALGAMKRGRVPNIAGTMKLMITPCASVSNASGRMVSQPVSAAATSTAAWTSARALVTIMIRWRS